MRFPDDDELYQVDQTYLGPPGRYIAPLRHRAIFGWLLVGPLTFVIYSQAGFPLTFLSVGLILLATIWVAMWLADKTSTERPISALLSTFWHDLSAPRSRRRDHHASGVNVRRTLRKGKR